MALVPRTEPDLPATPGPSAGEPGMKRRIDEHDWASTPLGPMDRWPQSLRIAVGICLSSRFPMFVWWGPHLINIYNDAYVVILGAKHPQALGRSGKDSWAEIWDVVGPQADAVMQRGEATWNERVLLTMDRHGYAEDTWFTWSYSPIYDEDGRIGGLFCACYEETPAVVAERERDALLRQVELERQRLAQAFAQSPSFLAIMRGPEHHFEYVNAKYVQLLGDRAYIGRPLRDVIPEAVTQGFVDILDRVRTTGVPYVGSGARIELQNPSTDGVQEVFLDFVYLPIRDGDRTITGVMAHGVDVTERYRAERTLRESERSFRDLADSMPQIVFSASAEGVVDYFNRQWYEYTGLAEGDIGVESWAKVHTAEGLERVMQAWPQAIRTGQPYEIEYPLRRHDGALRWHLGRALPVRDDDGRVMRWYGTNTDIHDRKQIEEALARALGAEQGARREAELASRMKDEFLATLSHELRTPLNAILGWAHMLRDGDATPARYARASEVIERNARAQSKIIDDLLDMSAIISGKVHLEVEVLDLPALVRSAIDTARPAADAKEIRVRADVDPLAELALKGDPNRLQQVLWNLLSNALKFTPKGGEITVTLRRTGEQLELAVADSGQGIAPEFLPHVFDRFRQADSTTTRRHGGLGLGLAIVKQLVELHGGTIRAESGGVGRGARFVVSLPIALRRPAAVASAAEEPAAARAARPIDARECAALSGMRVLVVDDEPDARDLICEVLRRCRADVVTAGSSAEAVQLAERQRFDVLVSDIAMPGEDGYTLITRLRALGANGAMPAMALTAYARPEDRARALEAGFQSHCAKPVDPGLLISVMASLGGRAGAV